jgi:PAS domain S-box-containing protein
MVLKMSLKRRRGGKVLLATELRHGFTDRKRSEEALRLSEERRSLALEAAQAGTWEWDLQTNENIWSDELWPLYGLDKLSCDPSFDAWQRIVHPDDLLKTEQVIKDAVLQASNFSTEWRVKLNDGAERWLMSRGRPLKDMHGCVVRYLGTVIDITDRKRSEEANKDLQTQLMHAQKMEAIGTLAGGIAHDFNNILGAVIGYSEIVRDNALTKSVSVTDVDQILKAGQRAKELVQQILAFSRQAQTNQILIKPKAIIKEAIKLLRASLPTTTFIKQDIDSDVGAIIADPIQIHQIVMNLCTNAFHAMEMAGGTLSISLTKKILGNEDVIHEPRMQPGQFVQLSIKDTGAGIGPDIREKIFGPYFTTKKVGKGTGLGLAMVHGIVQSLGGSIVCESRVGEGTTFDILLPTVATYTLPGDEAAALIFSGKEHILFIDDEEILNEMGKIMLERLDYRVTARSSSIEALTTFQNQPAAFDLVITDMTMPGMTGIDLARRILQIRPEMPVILCTGYSSLISEEKVRSMGIKGFAMKPMTKKEMSTLIRKILDEIKR